jgi:hypothetical protein
VTVGLLGCNNLQAMLEPAGSSPYLGLHVPQTRCSNTSWSCGQHLQT